VTINDQEDIEMTWEARVRLHSFVPNASEEYKKFNYGQWSNENYMYAKTEGPIFRVLGVATIYRMTSWRLTGRAVDQRVNLIPRRPITVNSGQVDTELIIIQTLWSRASSRVVANNWMSWLLSSNTPIFVATATYGPATFRSLYIATRISILECPTVGL